MDTISKNFGKLTMSLLVLVAISFFASPALGQPWLGSGTAEDPYQVWTAEDMQAIGGNSAYWGAHFKLMDDIDLSAYTGTSFNNIGNFSGVFDGNGHTISNFTDNKALFGSVSSQGTIQDLGLIAPNVIATAGGSTSSLAGSINERGATISGCYVEGGSITGYPAWYSNAGGLVGYNLRATITNCYSTAIVSCGDGQVGGLVGESYQGTITDCHSTGQVQGQRYSGGLVGRNDGPITNCYSTASVSGNEDVGGLVGRNTTESGSVIMGIITNSYSTGQVQGGLNVGGLVGSGNRIYNSYSVASVLGITNVGGLVGSGGTIYNSYSAGSVSGTMSVGGLLGNGGTITNSYSVSSVSGTTDVGGLVGIGGSAVYDSFWDIDVGGPDNGLGTPKTTLEMKTQSTFTNAGWDFVGEYENGPNDDWAQGTGGGYMNLWWQLAENELPALTFSGGTGTQSNPYLISSATDLNRIGNNGRLMTAHFKLINDIDLVGINLFVIGSQWSGYRGIFDGNGYTISNFTYTSGGADRIGLFRWVDGPGAEIKNLGLIDPTIDAGLYVGSLAGVLQARVSGCYVEGGSVSGGGLVGGLVGYKRGGTITNCDYSGSVSRGSGLVGYNSGTISNCFSDGSVSGGSGLVGENSGTISNCYSTASLSGGGDYRGGLVGNNSGTITDCYATGSPSGHWNIGGLVGFHQSGTITNCYATGSVSGTVTSSGNEAIGGLVGYKKSGGVSNCYYTGNVSGPGKDIGGLVGHNKGAINVCSSAGTVSSTSHHIGGLVGLNEGTGSTITNCYSTSGVSGGSKVGGLVGKNEGTIYYCYSAGSVSGSGLGGLVGYGGLAFFSFWDTETSGQTISAGGIGLPTAQMQMKSTFTAIGWDFFYTWDICDGTNYPKLSWQIPLSGDFVCPDGVDWNDLAVLCEQWLQAGAYSADIAPARAGDGIVNFPDFAALADNWLTGL